MVLLMLSNSLWKILRRSLEIEIEEALDIPASHHAHRRVCGGLDC